MPLVTDHFHIVSFVDGALISLFMDISLSDTEYYILYIVHYIIQNYLAIYCRRMINKHQKIPPLVSGDIWQTENLPNYEMAFAYWAWMFLLWQVSSCLLLEVQELCRWWRIPEWWKGLLFICSLFRSLERGNHGQHMSA